MIRKFCILLCCIFLLSGCTSKEQLLFTYEEYQNDIAYTNEDIEDTFHFMSEDLCVSPLNRKEKKDVQIQAEVAMLANISNKKMLYAKNEYEKVYPASVTKIVTALVALKYGKLSDTVEISYNASHITEAGAVTCGLQEGDKIKLETLLNAFLIRSGNDAGIAIAEHIGGSVDKFVNMMNEEMKQLGGVHSNFVNPHGLHDDNHYTTAYDIYLVFHELLSNKKYKKTFKNIIGTKEYKAEYKKANGTNTSMTFTNTNQYINGTKKMPEDITVIGGKTGTTNKAGSCLVLYCKDSKNKEYMSFIFQASDSNALYNQMSHLLLKSQEP